MPTAIVTSAAGEQAHAIAARFVSGGWDVRGLTRDPAKCERIASIGATPVAVDDADGPALAAALAGADVLVFTAPADYRAGVREALAGRYAEAARAAGIGRAVVNSAAAVIPGIGPNADALQAVGDAFLDALPDSVVLEPTIYLDNLAAPWMIDKIFMNGMVHYAAPAEARISWLSHRTLADFAFAAATSADARGKRVPIGGDTAFDGHALAHALGRAIGRDYSYQPLPLDIFVDKLNTTFGAPAGESIAENFIYASRHHDALVVDDAASRLLGVTPEPFDAWASRQDWSRAA